MPQTMTQWWMSLIDASLPSRRSTEPNASPTFSTSLQNQYWNFLISRSRRRRKKKGEGDNDSDDNSGDDDKEPASELTAEEQDLLELAGDIDEEELIIRRNNQVDDDKADNNDDKDG